MNQQTETQIVLVIRQLDTQKKTIPYLQDLDSHTLYSDFFHELSAEERDDVKKIIRSYIIGVIQGLKTKGGEMFQRFYEINEKKFREFRELNGSPNASDNPRFHELGQQFEQELYKFEQILTKNMMKKPQGLEKVTDAFYSIVTRFFPKYYEVE